MNLESFMTSSSVSVNQPMKRRLDMKKTGHLRIFESRGWRELLKTLNPLGVLSQDDAVWGLSLRVAATDMPP